MPDHKETADERRARHLGKGWIGVDFDGTIAEYHDWVKWDSFGKPIPAMITRIKGWIAQGHEVRIVTARVGLPIIYWDGKPCPDGSRRNTCKVSGELFSSLEMTEAIRAYCVQHIGCPLKVQNYKDVDMIELWDDRAIQVEANTGRALVDEQEAELAALRGKAFAGGVPVDAISTKTFTTDGSKVISDKPTIFELYDQDCIPGN
jgi:hypothetical protein